MRAGRGAGSRVDWCGRQRGHGWVHGVALGVVVFEIEGRSLSHCLRHDSGVHGCGRSFQVLTTTMRVSHCLQIPDRMEKVASHLVSGGSCKRR